MLTYQLWLLLGILLILSEFAVPGFVIFFFGIGALVTGGVKWFCPLPLSLELLLFLLVSLASLFGLRRYFPNAFQGKKKQGELPDEDLEFAGENAEVLEDIHPEKEGKVFFHGTTWNARAERAIPKGATVTVVRRENISLIVK